MPKFNNQFARQNRCKPLLEFSLALPYLSIVHYLLGPNSYALTQIYLKTLGLVDSAPKGFLPLFTFITRLGLTPKHLYRC